MRISTLLCWLFGHKFVGKDYIDESSYKLVPTSFCVRCGIHREKDK